jgi:hypothetical protein
VVGCADQSAGPVEGGGEGGEFGEGADLPAQVVEPDRGGAGGGVGQVVAPGEQADVVVVGRVRGLQERRGAGAFHDEPEAQQVAVETDAAVDVADVEDGVVEPMDAHPGVA